MLSVYVLLAFAIHSSCTFSTSYAVLRFEPDNPTAREFYPVLVEKIRIGKQLMHKAVSVMLRMQLP